MSNEVKRWWIDLRPHSNARAQGYSTRHSAWSRPIVRFGVNAVCVMPVKDHERIVAQKDGELLTFYRMAASGVWIESKEYDELLKTIATQKRVIEKLREQRDVELEDNCWNRGNGNIDNARQKYELELEAIEQGEGT